MFKTGVVHLVMDGVRRARCRDVHAAGTTLTSSLNQVVAHLRDKTTAA
jgi:hypothetical protein